MTGNRDRCNRVSETLDFHATMTGDRENVLVDLVSDLMHYCDQCSKDFANVALMAEINFNEEVIDK